MAGATNNQAFVLLFRHAVLDFIDQAFEDMQSGRDSWRVVTLLSTVALAISALYLW